MMDGAACHDPAPLFRICRYALAFLIVAACCIGYGMPVHGQETPTESSGASDDGSSGDEWGEETSDEEGQQTEGDESKSKEESRESSDEARDSGAETSNTGDEGQGATDEGSAEDSAAVEEGENPAWTRYREAFEAFAEGDEKRAVEILEKIERDHPEHPAALAASSVLRKIERGGAEPSVGDETDEMGDDAETEKKRAGRSGRLGIETPTTFSRAELISFQTLHGIGLGAELCAMASCFDARAVVGSMLLGGGAGLGASVLGTQNGIVLGHALSLNAGTLWGFWNAAIVNAATQSWSSPAATFGPLIVGQLAGLGAGELAWQAFRPYSGDVALYNSAGIWAGVVTRLFMNTASLDPSPAGLHVSLLAATNLGAVGGGFFASENPFARGRVYVTNSAGLFGGLVGLGSAVLVGGAETTGPAASGATIVGALGGLGVGAYLTRKWPLGDGESNGGEGDSVSMMLRPRPFDDGAILSVGGRF